MSDRGKSTHPMIPNDRESAPLSGDSPPASDESTSDASVSDGLQAFRELPLESIPSEWLKEQLKLDSGDIDLNTTGRIPVTRIELGSRRQRRREQIRVAQRTFKKKLKEKLQDKNSSDVAPLEGSDPSSPDRKPSAGETASSQVLCPAKDSPSPPPTTSRFQSMQRQLQQEEPSNSRPSSSEKTSDSLPSGTPGHADSSWAHDTGPLSPKSTGNTSNLPLSQAERDESGSGSHN